ncbi:MAG: cell division protein ZapE [Pseudomonadota bacterium]
MKPTDHYLHAVREGRIHKDEAQLNALGILDRIHEQLTTSDHPKESWLHRFFGNNDDPVRGAYLWGGVGTGKTLVMDLFVSALPEGMARRIHFHRYMQSVHDEKSSISKKQNPLEIIARNFADRHRVLCLDEFAVTDITDAMILHGLLKHLFQYNVVLITTSNTVPDNLYQDGLQRARFLPAIELLNQHTHVIEVDFGKDYRMAFLQNAETYLVPADDTAIESMRAAFSALTGESDAGSELMEINGRDVPVVALASGVVWFECKILCESPRSKVDYIELSRQFHTLFLSDVPVFDRSTEDAARRFIELIDEMYDRGVNVIISAEELPDRLYQGKRLIDPFQRTISRLQEMQSEDYLAKAHLP